jgi:hypothetical protein
MSSSLDWRSVVRALAPTLGSALTAANPLFGAAVSAIGAAITGDPDATEAEVAKAVERGMPPEAIVALRQADQAFELRCRELGLDARRIEVQAEGAYLADVANARTTHAGNAALQRLGYMVLGTFALVLCGVLLGIYQVLTGGISIQDVGVVAAVFSLLGSVVGYAAANAQQVISYWFGSSAGSRDKTERMAEAVAKFKPR